MSSEDRDCGLSVRFRSVLTLMSVLVGEVEMVDGSVLVLGEVAMSDDPLSLSFFPNTRPKMPPLVEDLLSEEPASLTTSSDLDESSERRGFGKVALRSTVV